MRYAFIDANNKVINVIIADEDFANAHNNSITEETVNPRTLVAVSDSVKAGDTYFPFRIIWPNKP